jgi:hypothetical protein
MLGKQRNTRNYMSLDRMRHSTGTHGPFDDRILSRGTAENQAPEPSIREQPQRGHGRVGGWRGLLEDCRWAQVVVREDVVRATVGRSLVSRTRCPSCRGIAASVEASASAQCSSHGSTHQTRCTRTQHAVLTSWLRRQRREGNHFAPRRDWESYARMGTWQPVHDWRRHNLW